RSRRRSVGRAGMRCARWASGSLPLAVRSTTFSGFATPPAREVACSVIDERRNLRMLRLLLALVCLFPLGAAAQGRGAAGAAYRDARLPVEVRVRDLLGRMTPEEKFWQLFMIPGSLDDPAHDYSQGIFGLQIPAD